MKIKCAIIFLFFTYSFSSNSAEIFNCTQEGFTSIGYSPSKNRIVTEKEIKKDSRYNVTLVVDGKFGILKGNNANGVKLARSGNTFIEATGSNLIMWKIIKDNNKKNTTYLYQLKAYGLGGPISYTYIYSCK